MDKTNKAIIAWIYALGCAVITGAADGLINMQIAPEVFNLQNGRDALIGTILLKGFIAAALYLKRSPLPPIE